VGPKLTLRGQLFLMPTHPLGVPERGTARDVPSGRHHPSHTFCHSQRHLRLNTTTCLYGSHESPTAQITKPRSFRREASRPIQNNLAIEKVGIVATRSSGHRSSRKRDDRPYQCTAELCR
jgi:hypothetical protein